jgi:hypothetical protein
MDVLSRRVPAWVITIVLIAAAFYTVARSRRDFWDFEVFRTAAVRAMHAEPLYQPEDGHYQYKYWPAFAVAMAPFGALPKEVGKPAWFALSVWLLVVLVRRSIRDLPDRRLTERVLVAWTAVLVGKFVVIELVNGQANLVLAVLVMCAVGAARTGRRASAGALVALAAFIKPYALVLLPWVAISAGPSGLVGFSLALAGGLALPALIYGWTGNLALLADWYRTVSDTTSPNLLVRENASVASLWAKWIGIGPTASMLGTFSAVGLLALPLLALRWRDRVTQPDYVDVALPMLLVALISPQGWDYVLLLGVPAFACLVDRSPAMSIPWRLVTVAGFFVVSFSIYDVMGRRLYFVVMDYSIVTVAAIALAVTLLGLRYRRLA